MDTIAGQWYDWWQRPSHGTWVAGVAAAGTDNAGVGIAGATNLDPNHDDDLLVALKVSTNIPGNDKASTVPKALSWVCNPQVYDSIGVVNFSIGTGGRYKNCRDYNAVVRDAFRNAFLKDISLVCAAGQGEWECIGQSACSPSPDTCFIYPAAYLDYCLAVTGIDCRGDDCMARLCFGSYVDLTAPGWGIVTTAGGDQTADTLYSGVNSGQREFGTSFAAPLASGAIALLLGKNSSLTNEDCYTLLEAKASPLDGYSSAERGHGLLRVDRALAALSAPWTFQHDSVTSFTADSIGAREHFFRNLSPPIYAWTQIEAWEDCWVHVYEIEATADLCTQGAVIVDTVWARGKTSTGWKNLEHYDAKFHANHAEFVGYGDDSCEAVFRTYTYKLYTKTKPRQFLRWEPFDPEKVSFKIDYSFISRTPRGLSSEAPTPQGTDVLQFGPRKTLILGGRAVFDIRLPREGTFTLAIYDATGRLVSSLFADKPLAAGAHEFQWYGLDNRGRKLPGGLYFAKLSGVDSGLPERTSRFIVIR